MNEPIQIPSVIELIAQVWYAAELSLKTSIENKHPDLEEDYITRFFHGELREKLRQVSEEKKIEAAFLEDLNRVFPDLSSTGELREISSGLIAKVTLHPKETERITGGDLGLLLGRPTISKSYDGLELIVNEHRCGVLCQAKLKGRKGKWGAFTKNQKIKLSDHLPYLMLLLYQYGDVNRTRLCNFYWQECKGKSLHEIEKWLKYDSFPGLLKSGTFIELIGDDKIGTSDDKIIDNIICPETRPAMIIRVMWPDKPSNYKIDISHIIKYKINQVVRLRN